MPTSVIVMVLFASTRLATYSDDAMRGAFPAGCDGKGTVCEASGSKMARGLNMIHFRLEQAKQAQRAKNKDGCQAEAQAAVALSQGLPKFRKSLGSGWAAGKSYQTRWDGTLSEEQAWAKVTAMGEDAKKLFGACGGKTLSITDADEMAFKPTVNPADYPASIDNRDQQIYDYEVGACPRGNSARGAVVAMGSSNLGGGVDGCTLTVVGAGTMRLKGGMTCTIFGHALQCK